MPTLPIYFPAQLMVRAALGSSCSPGKTICCVLCMLWSDEDMEHSAPAEQDALCFQQRHSRSAGQRKWLLKLMANKLCVYPELWTDMVLAGPSQVPLRFTRAFITTFISRVSKFKRTTNKHTQTYKHLSVWVFNHQTLKCCLCNKLGDTHLPKCCSKMSLQSPQTK